MPRRMMAHQEKRQEYVDIIKGWAMLLIVVFHSSSGLFPQMFYSLIGGGMDVVIFFIIAGFFIKSERLMNPKGFIQPKLKTLYVPATVIYVCSVLLHNVFVDIGWYPLGEIHAGNGQPFHYYDVKDFALGVLKAVCCAGSGELAMGAMWFLYSLLYSMIGLSLLAWGTKKLVANKIVRERTLIVILLIGLIASCVMTQIFSLTINRLNVSITAMALIYLGKKIYQDYQWTFDNTFYFIISCLIFVSVVFLQKEHITMARNKYQDILQLCVGGGTLLYIWGYIAKRIVSTWVGKLLALIGRESLYIMALHIVGFFICNSLMELLGVYQQGDPKGMYTYKMQGNILIFICYMVFAIGFSLTSINLFRRLKSIILPNR